MPELNSRSPDHTGKPNIADLLEFFITTLGACLGTQLHVQHSNNFY